MDAGLLDEHKLNLGKNIPPPTLKSYCRLFNVVLEVRDVSNRVRRRKAFKCRIGLYSPWNKAASWVEVPFTNFLYAGPYIEGHDLIIVFTTRSARNFNFQLSSHILILTACAMRKWSWVASSRSEKPWLAVILARYFLAAPGTIRYLNI